MNSSHFRKRPTHWLPDVDPDSQIVFVTCCTKARRRCLDRDQVPEALRQVWQAASAWRVGRYVVMPDHIHLFCAPQSEALPLGRWMAYWRSMATRSLGESGGEFWQREYWDRHLRSEESYSDKWEYVRHNPVRAGLVERPQDWPYQGELNSLEWLGLR